MRWLVFELVILELCLIYLPEVLLNSFLMQAYLVVESLLTTFMWLYKLLFLTLYISNIGREYF